MGEKHWDDDYRFQIPWEEMYSKVKQKALFLKKQKTTTKTTPKSATMKYKKKL